MSLYVYIRTNVVYNAFIALLEKTMNLALVIGLLLLLIIFASMVSRTPAAQKQNLENTIKYCEENNYEFVRNMKFEDLPKKLQEFTTFQRHIGYKEFHSIVKGNYNNYDFSLMTFIYPGNNSTYGRLICLITKKEGNYPDFYLRDTRTVIDTVGKLLGKQDINISDDKKFSDQFLLQGNNQEQVINYFNSARRNIILKEHVNGYEYEADSEYFAISYPLSPSIPVEEYKALLSKTVSILSKLEA